MIFKKLAGLMLMITLVAGYAVYPAQVLAAETADTIYTNGKIYTVDSKFSAVSALAVKNGLILYAGSSNEALGKYRGAGTKVMDLAGKTVIPGIVESHLHYQRIGERLERIDIFQKPKAEILDKVKAEAARLGAGEWVVSSGWNHELWDDKSWPTKEDLDKVAPNNPVALTRVDAHSVWVNSAALKKAGITKDTPNPAGGTILKDSKGDLLGILTDTAAAKITAVIPPVTSEDRILKRYAEADKSIISYGITTLVDAGISNKDLKILKKAYEGNKLKVRAYEMLYAGEDANYMNEKGNSPVKDLYKGKFSANAVKIVADGSLGSRSAWMKSPYSDAPDVTGDPRYASKDELNAAIKRASDYGFQIGAHAIGDAAVGAVIDGFVKAVGEGKLADRRFRIEHFQIVDPADMPRAIKLGIIASMQSTHATSDMNMAEDRIGAERLKTAYAWRTVINNGGIIANGSDAPVELVNPYHGLYAAVTRQDRDGNPQGGWHPEQALTREEALKSFTIWGAHAIFAEKNRGSLEAGKYADFAVIDKDYMKCPASEIKDIRALATVIGGEVVYGKIDAAKK